MDPQPGPDPAAELDVQGGALDQRAGQLVLRQGGVLHAVEVRKGVALELPPERVAGGPLVGGQGGGAPFMAGGVLPGSNHGGMGGSLSISAAWAKNG